MWHKHLLKASMNSFVVVHLYPYEYIGDDQLYTNLCPTILWFKFKYFFPNVSSNVMNIYVLGTSVFYYLYGYQHFLHLKRLIFLSTKLTIIWLQNTRYNMNAKSFSITWYIFNQSCIIFVLHLYGFYLYDTNKETE